MWKSLLVLVCCFCLKAHFVLGAEETTSEAIVAEIPADSNPKEIQVAQVTTQTVALGDATSVLGVRQSVVSSGPTIAFYPLIGAAVYSTRWWRNQVANAYTAGLGLEIPVNQSLSLGLEGSYGDYEMAYRTDYTPNGFRHGFAVYTAGLHGKVYLLNGFFRPYLGGGMDALYFEGLTMGPPATIRYDRWVGAATAMAGADIALSQSLSLGARCTYTKPFLNTPGAFEAISATPEAGVLSQDFFKVLGTVKVSL